MRNRPTAGTLIIGLFLFQFPACVEGASHPIWYSPELKVSSNVDIDQKLRARFEEGAAHPPGVSTCAQLLARGHTPRTQGSENETQAGHITLTGCLVLHELRYANRARVSYVRDLKWDEGVLPLLPPQLAITVSSDSERAVTAAASRGQSWLEFDPTATATTKGPQAIVVTGSGFRQQLILWGRADFDKDGTEDLLVQSLDTLTEGTYRNTRLIVITRKTSNGRLVLVRSLL